MSPGRFDPNAYVSVSERVEKFRADHATYGLLSELLVDDGTRVVMRATVTDENGMVVAQGHAEEIRGDGPVNKTNPVENCETSAWGRALAALGYEVTRGIASREEMQRAHDRQGEPEWKRLGYDSQDDQGFALENLRHIADTLTDAQKAELKALRGNHEWTKTTVAMLTAKAETFVPACETSE